MIPGLTQCPRRRSSRQQQQQQSGEGARSSRSSSSSSSSSHHFHHHSHHHHHHHHRPRVSRTQITDLDQTSVADPAFLNDLASSSTRTAPNADRLIRSRMPLLAQQHRSETEAHRVAVEARGRLDERLREVGRRNPHHSLPRLAHHYFNALFSDDDEENFVWEEEHEWEASFSEWIAGRVPGLREPWPPWMNELPATPLHGLSKAAINALPREVYQLKKSKEEQVDCSVCLEQFTSGESLLRLPCKHKFHPACLTPWLETHDQCPYCRARITSGALSRNEPESDNLLSWLEAFETGMSRRFTLNS